MYREIEDPIKLARLSKELTVRIRRHLKYRVRREVGYPSGHATFPVNFGAKRGKEIHWWSSELSANGEAYNNFVGRGNPESSAYLMIDLQFNVPVKKFSRAHGGAFVEDIESGAVVLAHRGIVSRGRSRVKRKLLLRETSAKTTSVATSSGDKDLFLVTSLNSKYLVEDIADFAQEMRRAADVAMTSIVANQTGVRLLSERIDSCLRRYSEEFCGQRRIPRREAVVAEVRHGRVVRHLKEALVGVGELLSSQKIDLAVRTRSDLLLFEVKTAVSPYDLYTAIGQLLMHSLSVGDQFPGSFVKKILVVPSGPTERVRRRLKQSLGIEVLTFRWSSSLDVQFDPANLNSLRG